MSSKTDIGNLALVNLGVSAYVTDVDTEESMEAITIRRVFDVERDYVLKDLPWPFARQFATLDLVTGSSDDPAINDFIFAYRYPSNCLDVKRILTPTGRKDQSKPPYIIGRDDQGKLICCNIEDAAIEYTAQITNPEEFDPMFCEALAWRISSKLAPVLPRTGKTANECLQMYEFEKSKAGSRALNEEQSEEQPDASWIAGR